MSEEPKMTTIEKPEQKVTNPGRVAAGRRLAAISKEAKARKAEERKKAEEECTGNANLLYVSVGVLGVTGLGYGVYNFLCKGPQRQELQQEQPQQQQQEQLEKKIILMICK